MLGSSASIADTNTVINTAVAEVLRQFADELEAADDFSSALHALIRRNVTEHKRILFNGNGYDDAWIKEAEKRGLANLRTTPEALDHYLDEKNVKLFTENNIFSVSELKARYEIHLERYAKVLNIEALTMADMCRSGILPAISRYTASLAENVKAIEGIAAGAGQFEKETVAALSELSGRIYKLTGELDKANTDAKALSCSNARAHAYSEKVLPVMEELRRAIDTAEPLIAADFRPFPDYGKLLFGIK